MITIFYFSPVFVTPQMTDLDLFDPFSHTWRLVPPKKFGIFSRNLTIGLVGTYHRNYHSELRASINGINYEQNDPTKHLWETSSTEEVFHLGWNRPRLWPNRIACWKQTNCQTGEVGRTPRQAAKPWVFVAHKAKLRPGWAGHDSAPIPPKLSRTASTS